MTETGPLRGILFGLAFSAIFWGPLAAVLILLVWA